MTEKASISYIKANKSYREEISGIRKIRARERELQETKGAKRISVVFIRN